MPATIVVTPGERPVMCFALARAIAFYQLGTAEQRESVESLSEMLTGLEEAPPGAVEMDFLTQDAYLLGIRLYAISVELEDYWLDARQLAQGPGQNLPPSDPELVLAVRRYFPEIEQDPVAWNIDRVRGAFTSLGFKLDRAITAAAPRARAMYNADRQEADDKAVEIMERHARARAGSAEANAVAVGEASVPSKVSEIGWGVDVPTGLSPDDIPAESFRTLHVGSVTVLLTKYGGRIGAISGTCSHQAANLAGGQVQGTTIACPRHGSEYDLRTGRELCPPFCQHWMDTHGMVGKLLRAATPEKTGGDLPVYPLRVEDGEIVLRI